MKDVLKDQILKDKAISAETKKLIFVLDAINAPVEKKLIEALFGPAFPNWCWEINHCTDYARIVSNPNLGYVQIFTSKAAYKRAHKEALKALDNLPSFINKFMFPEW